MGAKKTTQPSRFHHVGRNLGEDAGTNDTEGKRRNNEKETKIRVSATDSFM